MTETSSLSGLIQREQHKVEAVYEEDLRKPFRSCNAEGKILVSVVVSLRQRIGFVRI